MVLKVPEPFEFMVRLQAGDSSIVAGKPLTLRALISPESAAIQSIEWRPPHLFTIQDTLRQSLIISQTTNFNVELIDKNGCSAHSNLTVVVEQTNIYIPNALKQGSPQDAYFTIYAGEGVKSIAYLRIFSRTGARVFERINFPPNDPLAGWNGRWDGEKVQMGVYLYMADVVMLDGTVQHFEGSVTVLE